MNFKRFIQPSATKNEKDVSYSISSLGKEEIKTILSTSFIDGVFGIESHRTAIGMSNVLFTPPNSRFNNWNKCERDFIFANLNSKTKDITYVQLYTEKSSVFPVEMDINESFWDILCSICPKHINIIYQLLLVYRQDNWKDRLSEQYDDYLKGIENPADTKLFRKIQRNINDKIDNVLKWEHKHSTIPEIDRKLRENGFRYSMRFVLYGGTKSERKRVVEEVEERLERFSYLNKWRVDSSFIFDDIVQNIIKRKLDNNSKYQVLSVSELIPFITIQKENNTEIETKIISNENLHLEVLDEPNNPIEYLPYGNSSVEIDEELITDKFIRALKDIRKYSGKIASKGIQSGATLMKLTINLPKAIRYSEVNKKNVIEDIQISMGVKNIQVQQGDDVGELDVLIPLENRQKILLRNYIDTDEFREYSKNNPLAFLVGADIVGNPIYSCVSKIKHLLIAGTTGSGKSVWLNQLILTLLLTKKSIELQFYMIDIKQVELTIFEDFPHVQSIVTDVDEGISLLKRLINEMNRRYKVFRESEVKDISLYNQKHPRNKMPYIICVIDEYAELSGRNTEIHEHVQSLIQLSRACGIHLIIATQRPSVDVIPSIIKSNLPSKIGFYCATTGSYLTFLNTKPPFNLLGKGDGTMCFEGEEEHIRFQGCLIVDDPNNTGIESKLIKKIAMRMNEPKFNLELPIEDNVVVSDLERLKQCIATTGETRVGKLREMMKININKLNELMKELVEEEWLEAPVTKQSGYKLIADREEIEKWKE